MFPSSSNRNRTAWIGLAALLALLVGIAVGIRQWRAVQSSDDMPTPTPVVDSLSDSTVEEALRQIPVAVDSAELKSRWTDEVKGVDASSLSADRRRIFVRFANAERCTCGCGFTLAACRTYDLTCPVSLPRVEALLDSVASGRIRSAAGLRERPASVRSPRATSGG